MSQRKFTIGIAVAAAIALPLSLTTPALADDEASTGYGIASEATVDAAELLAVEDHAESLRAQQNKDADIADLDLGNVTADASVTSFSIANSGSITVPSSGTKTKSIKTTITGPADYYKVTTTHSPKVDKKNSKVKSSYVRKPGYYPAKYAWSTEKTRGTELDVYRSTTPGRYKLKATVEQYTTGAKKTATNTVVVKANTKVSKSATYLSGSARSGKTFPLTVKAPYYQAGAKVSVYYKAPGKKKYKKVRTGTLKSYDKYNSRAKINISKKYNLGGKGGRIYVKIGGVAYAPAYKSASAKLYKY